MPAIYGTTGGLTMKITTAAIAATLLLSVQANAQTSTFPFWVGAAVIDNVTPACASGGQISKNDIVNTDYRAKTGVAGEPNNPGVTFSFPRSSIAYFRAGGSNANTMQGAGTYGGYVIRGNVTTIPNPSQQPFTGNSNFAVTPASITGNTQTISINGTITNWRAVAGCTVTFRAAYRLAN